jgi:4'-phosphopantetheinyl transferase
VALLDEELHVWTAAVPETLAPETRALYESWLSAEEAERCRRYVRASDRRLFLVAHALLRHSLSRYAEVEPAAWRFDVAEHGRPELAPSFAELGVRFNLSHTPGLAAVVISDRIDAGVDVECRDRRTDLASVARTVFADSELRDLEQLEPAAYRARFFELWTLKEAYIKARGLGLALPLRDIAFSIGPHGAVDVAFEESIGDDAAQWQFLRWPPSDVHQGAVALRSGVGALRRVRSGCGFARPGLAGLAPLPA